MKKTGAMSLLDEALEAWAYTREGVIAEVKNLPESALDFKPTDASRTTRALVEHILESVPQTRQLMFFSAIVWSSNF